MPVLVDSNHFRAPMAIGKPSPGFYEGSSRCITIGLINNMPDSALEATERQFTSLLDSASDGMMIRLSRYMLPDVPRQEAARRYLNSFYTSVEDLWDHHLDGLIVTGREPLTTNLMDESYWKSFTRVVEWAQSNTHSTVWSCLAAHAAILHLDGITRVKRDDKLCGIFDCARATDHRLTAGIPARFRLPHSRWNGVPEDQLLGCGYRVLTRAAEAGIDTFIKQQKALFVFFQGHPEYESDTLLREYRRDVGRYFKGESDKYPSMPRSYFNSNMVEALAALQERAICSRNGELLLEISSALAERTIENTWNSSATHVYKNWLDFICAQKERTLRSKRIKAMTHAARVEWASTTLKRSDRGVV
jgi:homoserine O-succinyltransferase/O-acetyltransferase